MSGSEKKLIRRRLIPVVIFLFLLLVIFRLPVFIKGAVNRFVLPTILSDSKIPVTGVSVEKLTYHELVTGRFLIDAGSGVMVTVPEIRAVYSPGSLLRKRIHSVAGSMSSTAGPVFDAGFWARDIHLAADGIEAELSAQCSQILFGDYRAGPIEFSTRVEQSAAAFSFDVPLQDGLLSARVDVNADWKTNLVWTCSVELPFQEADGSPLQLGMLVPELKDVQVAGNLRVDAEGTDASASAMVFVEVSSLDLPEPSLKFENLATRCALQWLDEPRSLPGQKLTVQSVSFGDFLLEQVDMTYQLEPGPVLYIEALELELCGGTVSVNNTRIRPEMTDVTVHLQCAQLSLEQLLSACGVDGFSGDGELNGRLPVQWVDGGIQINRGSLYTTPGRSGVFSLSNAQSLESVLPPGSVEAGQVGLVASALAEFRYEWITMTLNSEGENLIVVVEMGGTPIQVLPYEYDSKRETYVKVPLRPGRGTRQPMQLKLNLTVPLNRLLSYASGVNRQWDLFKGSK